MIRIDCADRGGRRRRGDSAASGRDTHREAFATKKKSDSFVNRQERIVFCAAENVGELSLASRGESI